MDLVYERRVLRRLRKHPQQFPMDLPRLTRHVLLGLEDLLGELLSGLADPRGHARVGLIQSIEVRVHRRHRVRRCLTLTHQRRREPIRARDMLVDAEVDRDDEAEARHGDDEPNRQEIPIELSEGGGVVWGHAQSKTSGSRRGRSGNKCAFPAHPLEGTMELFRRQDRKIRIQDRLSLVRPNLLFLLPFSHHVLLG